jgi:hypothetical protein
MKLKTIIGVIRKLFIVFHFAVVHSTLHSYVFLSFSFDISFSVIQCFPFLLSFSFYDCFYPFFDINSLNLQDPSNQTLKYKHSALVTVI